MPPTLRVAVANDGFADGQAAADVMVDCDPGAENAEGRAKASALMDAVRDAATQIATAKAKYTTCQRP